VVAGEAAEAQVRWASFVALGEDDPRELVDGRLEVLEVPSELHEWIVATLVRLLGNWAAEHGGMALGSGYKVRIDDTRGAMPDVQYYRRGRVRGHDPDGLREGAPDLVVEVISPTSRRHDRVKKLGWYASISAAEYWLIDPEARTLEQLVLEQGSYRIACALSDDEVFTPDSFAGLSVELARLWVLPE